MNETKEFEQPYVFGLDIGTRNVVGTVGCKEGNEFIVVAQYVMQHETRAMIDGQIHDIGRVGKVIQTVKEELEKQIECPLTEVCIAAAGRVLKTVTTNVEYEYPEETVVTREDIHTLDLLGIEKAQSILKEKNDTKYKFYCVGYSVVKYYLNDEVYSNIEGHKADIISEDIIVTFLPEDVVDGLYSAVAQAGLSVANMTLEPIAAIDVAIPEAFRMLNIALVDVGAGTSDISVTRDGSIIAYGMIPLAGDELTELIVQHYLVDFKTAERIKLASTTEEMITYKDIMMIEHTIPAKEVWELTEPVTDKMTTAVAEKIKELNGGQSVSATFVVGGGGKIHGYTEMLAEKLGLPKERVALRGEEVLQEVTFEQPDIEKDPLIVTPIGICLNYYDQKNSFIMVHLNGERVKMYDNNKLLIMDAALQAGVANEDLFPKRGKEINYTVNGAARVERGLPGESAVITMNGKTASINTKLEPNAEIEIIPSTAGADAVITIEQLEEYHTSTVTFIVNGKKIVCPRFVEVNGELQPAYYQIKEGDEIETRAYYTVEQVAEFMDVEIDTEKEIIVNNRVVDQNYLVYENFNIEWTILSFRTHESDADAQEASEGTEEGADVTEALADENADGAAENENLAQAAETLEQTSEKEEKRENEETKEKADPETEGETVHVEEPSVHSVEVIINGTPVTLTGKVSYTFVDIFDFYEFDLSASAGRGIITKLNGQNAQYTAELKDGDEIVLAWKEK
jgi:cell division protein FtsA